jgi:NitT/TauT family transport system substrate-binding protein
MPVRQSRRRFLASALAMGGTAALVSARRAFAVEGALETTSVRLPKIPSTCVAPQDIAEGLLRAEGFTDIRFVPWKSQVFSEAVAAGDADFSLDLASHHISVIDRGGPIVVLAGVHIGCYELLAREGILSIADLKGKTVGVIELGSGPHLFVSVMAAHIGLDPVKDIRWITSASPKPAELFADGKIDAFLGFPPEPQDLRARHIGHAVLKTAVDRPWSQYFCCMVIANREYVRKYPVATKRVLRAILKAADLCVTDPAGVARQLVDGGFVDRYDYALETLSELPYDKWREYEPEDTVRFYALRLHEAGLIKSSPQKIIADGTDWRFLNELKRELKT